MGWKGILLIMYVEINVTQENIDKGILGDAYCCPIARSICADQSLIRFAGVSREKIHFANKYKVYKVYLPKEAQKFVEDFGKGNPVEPFKFKIKVTKKVADAIKRLS